MRERALSSPWAAGVLCLLGALAACGGPAPPSPPQSPDASSGTRTPARTVAPSAARSTIRTDVAAARTVVSLTFNDGTISQFRYARPLLREHKVAATFYLATERIEKHHICCISWGQAQTLYREGDDIGGETLDHVDLTAVHDRDWRADYAYKKREICDDRARLVRHGLDPRSFAYPAGAAGYTFPDGSSLADLVKSCGYLSGRIVGGLDGHDPANRRPPATPFAVRTPAEGDLGEIQLADLQKSVVQAAGAPAPAWVPLVFSEVCHEGDEAFASCMRTRRPIRDGVLGQFLDWLGAAGRSGGAPAGTAVGTMRDAIGAPPRPALAPPTTYVSLTFDDGDRTQITAHDLLKARGLHGTFFINSGVVDRDDGSTMTWDQLHTLAADGDEIAGHTLTHVDLTDAKLSPADKRHEVCDDRTRLLDQGFTPVSFAYPYGAFDAAAEAVVKSCGYASARSAGSVGPGEATAESVPPADPYATFALENPPSGRIRPADLENAVTTAAENGGGWVQVVLHRICSATTPDYLSCLSGENPIEDADFAAFLDWLVHGAPAGTTVRTVAEVMKLKP